MSETSLEKDRSLLLKDYSLRWLVEMDAVRRRARDRARTTRLKGPRTVIPLVRQK